MTPIEELGVEFVESSKSFQFLSSIKFFLGDTMTPKEIEKKYMSLVARRNKVNADMAEFQRAIQNQCHHPEEFVHQWTEQVDNGYGKWWDYIVRTCRICGQDI